MWFFSKVFFFFYQWEAGIWSCDLRANERPRKKIHEKGHMYKWTGIATLWKNRPRDDSLKTQHRSSICLAKHICILKDKSVGYSIKFKQLAQASGFNPKTYMGRLCLTKKYFNIFQPEGSTMNNIYDFFCSCRHKAKHLLCNPHGRK